MAELAPVIAYPEGCKATLQWGNRVLVGGKADFARIVVTPWSERLEVKVNRPTGMTPTVKSGRRRHSGAGSPTPSDAG
jgi:hypothetical protein